MKYYDIVVEADDVKKDETQRIKSFRVRIKDAPVSLDGTEEQTVTMPDDINVHSRMLENHDFDRNVERQIKFGELLASLLLPDHSPVREKFEQSRAYIREGEGLRLRLRLADELAPLPWEFTYIQKERGERTPSSFLALDSRISIVRHSTLGQDEGFRIANKRRIVIAMASPQPYSEYPKLGNLPEEQKEIKKALDKVEGIDVAYLPQYKGDYEDDIPGASVEDVAEAITQTTDIFHFSGHGGYAKELGPGGGVIGQGGIVLADKNNRASLLEADRLMELLRGKGIRLAVLGACETGMKDSFNAWSSVVASLLRGGIPAVIAMQFSITDDLAAAFMESLYESLVAGRTIDEAVALGRAAIRHKALDGQKDARDWGVPVLYLRTPGGCIFDPVSDKEAYHAAEKKVNAGVIMQRGYGAIDRRDYDKALRCFHQVAQANPEDSDAFKAIVWLQQSLAMNDIDAGHYDEAISKLRDARSAAEHTDPLDPRALTLRGFVAKSMAQVAEAMKDRASAKKHYAEAARLFEHVSKLDPTNESAQNGLGNVQYGLGNLDAAIAAYNRAIELQPSYGYAHHDLAIAYEKKMEEDRDHASMWCKKALAAWRKAIESIPREDPIISVDYIKRKIIPRIRWLEQQCGQDG